VIGVVIFVVWFVGAILSMLIFAWRVGCNRFIYMVAFLHRPSRRNGIPWAFKSLAKAYAWPLVLIIWLLSGRPGSPVLFAEAAAEKLGLPTESTMGMATKWTAS
jgi:hypothetical protein